MSGTYVDTGWVGAPADVRAALASGGWVIDGTRPINADATRNLPGLVAVASYRELDGLAYVLLRSTEALPVFANITVLGDQHRAAIVGTWSMSATPMTVITTSDFFNRFTTNERATIWSSAVAPAANPMIGVGLMHGLANGSVDLTSAELQGWLGVLVAEAIITSDRQAIILTP